MPELNGIELARQIHAAKPDLPMVALTADSTMKQDLETGDRTFFAVLIKPFDEECLQSRYREGIGDQNGVGWRVAGRRRS